MLSDILKVELHLLDTRHADRGSLVTLGALVERIKATVNGDTLMQLYNLASGRSTEPVVIENHFTVERADTHRERRYYEVGLVTLRAGRGDLRPDFVPLAAAPNVVAWGKPVTPEEAAASRALCIAHGKAVLAAKVVPIDAGRAG